MGIEYLYGYKLFIVKEGYCNNNRKYDFIKYFKCYVN